MEYAALAESASSHPISKSSAEGLWQAELDRSRVTEVQEISGHGVSWPRWTECQVAAGNDKLMERLGVAAIALPSAWARSIHLAVDGAIRRAYSSLRT